MSQVQSQNQSRILEIEDYVDENGEEDAEGRVDDDQNSSAILEESSVKVKHIHKTENMFEKKNRLALPLGDRIRSIVGQIEYHSGLQ